MTSWFNRRAGETVCLNDDEPGVVLIGAGLPDWIRLPPELGGGQRKVIGSRVAPCPKCRTAATHFELDSDYKVAECQRCDGFVWYQKKTN